MQGRGRLLLWGGLVLLWGLGGMWRCSPEPSSCDTCHAGELRCDGAAILRCKQNKLSGCWEFERQECPGGQRCVSQGRIQCAGGCQDQCTPGALKCWGQGYVRCFQSAGGCWVWSSAEPCAAGEVCRAGKCEETGKICPSPPLCQLGAARCQGEKRVVCQADGTSGCPTWGSPQPCGAGERCQGGVCQSTPCTAKNPYHERRCVGEAIHWFDDCGQKGDFVKRCQAPQTCQGGVCKGKTCQDACQAGKMRCSGQQLQRCVKGASGCTVWQTKETCATGQRCDATTGKCETGGCTSDADCAPGQKCNKTSGKCEKGGCTSDADCASGQTCQNGSCVVSSGGDVGKACTSQAQCSGQICITSWPGGYCSAPCNAGKCPAGSTCKKVQTRSGVADLCFRSCTASANCRSGYVCLEGACAPACKSDADCGTGRVCDVKTGLCGTGSSGCTSDADCASGQKCNPVTKKCETSGCTKDADCASGQKCQNGSCVTPPCQSNADCPSGLTCQNGVCRGSGQPGTPGVAQTRKITVGGTSRSYVLYVGKSYKGTSPAPVLLAFHGQGDTASNFLQTSRWKSIADQKGIVVGALQAIKGSGPHGADWNAYSASSSNADLQFARAVLQEIRANHVVDAKKLYVVGFSQGGYFAYLYGMVDAGTLAAVAVQAASSPGIPLSPSRKIGVIFVVGTLDSAYRRAQSDYQSLKSAGHPTQLIAISGAGHCCQAQYAKNTEVWNFFQANPHP